MSPGHVVKAIIRNGLGFVSAPLYLFSRFFEVYTLAQRQLRQALHQAQSGIKNQLGKPPSAPDITLGISMLPSHTCTDC